MVYFSQGGTAAQVAGHIASGLRSADFNVELHNLRDAQPPGPDGYDLLGMGSPSYHFRPPFNVTDYVHGLPHLKGLPAFVFLLHGTYPGDAGNMLRHALAGKGAKEMGYFRCFGADYFLPYLKEGYLFSPGHPTPGELSLAEQFGRELASRLAGKRYEGEGYEPPPSAIYRFERFSMGRWLVRNLYSRMFRVEGKHCRDCDGPCREACPTRNISAAPDGRPVWGRNCLLCQSCEMTCPKDAISSPVSLPIFRPLMLYNIRKACRDLSLDHVRVVHRDGCTRRL